MPERTIVAPAISCHHCTATIERELGGLDGVLEVSADPRTRQVRVRWEDPASWEEIAATLEDIGYPPGA